MAKKRVTSSTTFDEKLEDFRDERCDVSLSALEQNTKLGRNAEFLSARTICLIVGAATFLKLMCLPAYRSTDFEVHRNWLAITSSLPISKWYYENTSEWTLDYPPFFAYFEYILSCVAYYFDSNMLELSNVNYASWGTVVFQKASVMVTDLVFVYGAKKCIQSVPNNTKLAISEMGLLGNPQFVLAVLLLTNFGLFIVDHIHFQYNGILFGVMLLSMARIMQGRNLEAAFWFAVLLNSKHIYMYMAPAYFVYLLKHYCFTHQTREGRVILTSFAPWRFMQLGAVVAFVFAASFGPFIVMGQLGQVLSRLFPFKRGLCHAYWAPNFWALYNLVDKVAATLAARLGFTQVALAQSSMTGGLVQEFSHAVLPSVSPLATLLCTLASILPALLNLWTRPSSRCSAVECAVLCAFSAFIFGWHVHEKAILLVVVPLSLLATRSDAYAHAFLMVSTVGHYSLFPLIFTQAETLVKISLFTFSTAFAFVGLAAVRGRRPERFRLPFMSACETAYVLGLVALEVYCSVVHRVLGLDGRLPFLPLMLTSCYCAVGVCYSWLVLCVTCLRRSYGETRA
ncbi:PREDICTED: probable dolichyl pyrophosphate Glc1Man9GlcNAc2 alpha-1,3-glucosyltransferase [Priapulus caudatus]|uniref:Alpha-1,3-glucosyltransferase n=1 Tax=Priapulus caudatus TaxID=37621 RepID=A0ABM1EEU9_PRICU|nr:PREDICTED: probable dolichyl pyrophosphate Glc1Man9GlcNAc2 alpha-1,3-glucosyltransferase [Priapulus caudatus]